MKIPKFYYTQSHADCDNWVKELYKRNLMFHFDDDPKDIISNVTKELLFSEEDCIELNKILDFLFSIEDYDIFTITCKLLEE